MSVTRWIQSLFRSGQTAKTLIGQDHLGNKYFELKRDGKKTKRFAEGKFVTEEYTPGSIPTEWEAWIRGSRTSPPTMEELQLNQRQREIILKRAEEVQKKDEELQQKEYEEGLVAKSPGAEHSQAGHASAPFYGNTIVSEKPLSTGKEFQPASWEPSVKKKTKNDETFQPESWQPGSSQSQDDKETFQPESWTPNQPK